MTEESKPLRPTVREVMKMAPARRWSLKALHASVRLLIPDAREVDVDGALTWNFGQGYVTRTYDHELETDVFQITERGSQA